MTTLVRLLPPLRGIKLTPSEKVEIVNHYGGRGGAPRHRHARLRQGVEAKANVAVWRTRGNEKQLVGEFAYQCKFEREDRRRTRWR